MSIYCYCNQVLPGKSSVIKDHWASKHKKSIGEPEASELEFRHALQLSNFECWLQDTPQGTFMVHGLAGNSLSTIFRNLRSLIVSGNSVALNLRNFYLDVLGKDYSNPEIEPRIECILDISLLDTSPTKKIKKSFIYPLLPNQEEEHRKSRFESSTTRRERHVASMKVFGVTRLTSWIQTTTEGKYIVVYSERGIEANSASERLLRGENCTEWKEIAAELIQHTGLTHEELSPNVEWISSGKGRLTSPTNIILAEKSSIEQEPNMASCNLQFDYRKKYL